MKTNNQVKKAKSGIFTRIDDEGSLIIFSPYTGLIFVIHKKDIDDILKWLNLNKYYNINETIRNALGFGWDKPIKNCIFPMPHYLSNKGKWGKLFWPTKFPILINWFLTGNCQLSCKYCDAEDLMRYRKPEPEINDLRSIANRVLSYNPIAVVLTGGEPMLSPYFGDCLKMLYNKTGLIVDTNGLNINEDAIKIFKKYNVVVRISIDSPIPKINNDLRCYSIKNDNKHQSKVSLLNKAIESLCMCLDNDIPVVIQTVATKKNINDLPSFGDRIFRMGIRSWRIHLVSMKKENKYYNDLNLKINLRRHHLLNIKKSIDRWKGMDVQILSDDYRNSVVITSPNGEFLTESDFGEGKIPIDEKNYYHPRIHKFFQSVSSIGHSNRYLSSPGIQLDRWLSE